MEGSKKYIGIDFTDLSGGMNSVESAINIAANQVHPDTTGCILRKSGILKYPGALGLSSSTTFSDYLRLLFIHRQLDTTETLYGLSGGNLSLVDKTTGALTTKYAMGGASGEGWACESFGKAWVVNGTSCVKIEGTTAYKIGIAAPPYVPTIGATTGGSLASGDYTVYYSYARMVGGAYKVFGKGKLIGTVTINSPSSTAIEITNVVYSQDPQVTHVVFWVKSPSEVIHYFFHEVVNDPIGTYPVFFNATITASTAKDTTLVYEVQSADSGEPPAATFVYAFANRLWVIKDNIFYYSQKAYSEYDLEIFPAANFRITPYKLTGIFSVGQNLYFNTESGILLLPGGDTGAQDYLIEPRWCFKYMRTVDRWNNGVIGLTNDGVRFFDGTSFTNYDMAYSIKNKIDYAYNAGANNQPCGFVYRRDIRNEYHLVFNTNSATDVNDTHLILNLDLAYYNTAEDFRFGWEAQPIAGNYAAVSRNDNTLYIGQSHETNSKVYKEDLVSNNNRYVYDATGVLLIDPQPYALKLRTKEVLFDIGSRFMGRKFYLLAFNNENYEVRFFVGTENGKTTPLIVIPATEAIKAQWDTAQWDADFFPADSPAPKRVMFPDDFNGETIYAEITQTADDPGFKLLAIRVIGEIEKGNFI